METLNGARRPPEPAFSVPQIGHDVAIFPATLFGARTTQVAGRRRTIVNGAKSDGETRIV